MVEVNIEVEGLNKTYNIPTSWDEVSVRQFNQLYRFKNENSNELLGVVNLISAISDIDISILLQMDIDDFKSLTSQVSFITTEVPKVEVDYLQVGEDKYYLYTDFNKLTTGEVITLETILESSNFDIHKVMTDLLCLFLRKKDSEGRFEKFTTDMLKRKDMFLELPVSQVYHVFGFFLAGRNSSKNNTKDSTRNNSHIKTLKEDSQKN